MSNIPKARKLLNEFVDGWNQYAEDISLVFEAIKLLDRKKPEFVAKRRVKALTWRQKMKVRELRATGMPLHEIAIRMGTNGGRVSEAINEEI